MSLDSLPTGHLRVLLDGLSVFEQHGLLLAGGCAFRAHEILYRPSQDLDFATGSHEALPDIAERRLTSRDDLECPGSRSREWSPVSDPTGNGYT